MEVFGFSDPSALPHALPMLLGAHAIATVPGRVTVESNRQALIAISTNRQALVTIESE